MRGKVHGQSLNKPVGIFVLATCLKRLKAAPVSRSNLWVPAWSGKQERLHFFWSTTALPPSGDFYYASKVDVMYDIFDVAHVPDVANFGQTHF
jgi:hypothetical protein